LYNQRRHMKKTLIFLSLLVVVAGFVFIPQSSLSRITNPKDTLKELKPEKIHTEKAQWVSRIITGYHYRKMKFNDSTSAVMFNAYLKSLDNSKLYFLKSDISEFKQYRYYLDDDLKYGKVDAAYVIFNRFRKRFLNRIDKNLKTIEKGFNFTKNDTYETDRDKATWSTSEEALDKTWFKILKNQYLGLKLAKKKDKDILKTLRRRFANYKKNIAQYTSEDVFQTYMNALSETYDPHTNYFSPISSDNFKIRMSKSLEGIGALLGTDNDYTIIREVRPGGPAFKSKILHPNDKVVAVAQGDKKEFVDVVGWRIDEVVQLIRGPKGTVVRLKVIPHDASTDGDPKVVRMVRDKIKLEEQKASKKVIKVSHNNKDYKIGVINIPSFYLDFDAYQKKQKDYASTSNDTRRLIKELQAENVDGILIDLRYNGGGSLKEAIDLTGLFIKSGPVVQVRGSDGKIDELKDQDESQVYTGPLGVLVNRYSASASEIFSGAIQDYKRGIIIGEQTYGKGSVQNVINLARFISDKKKAGQLNLTLAKYYRITGSSTQNKGVTPDIKIPSPYISNEVGESAQPSALPWDEIKSSSFATTDHVNDKLIGKLQQYFGQRLKTDEDLQNLLSDIKEIKAERKNTVVSLNEAKRRAEKAKWDKKRKERKERDKQLKKDEKRDVFLQNGGHILSEMIRVNAKQ